MSSQIFKYKFIQNLHSSEVTQRSRQELGWVVAIVWDPLQFVVGFVGVINVKRFLLPPPVDHLVKLTTLRCIATEVLL